MEHRMCRLWCFLLPLLAMTAPVSFCFAEEEQAPAPKDWHADFAAQVHTAWQIGDPMPQVSVARPETTLVDAYSIQQHFVERVLDEGGPGAFKVGIVAEASQRALGLDKPLVGVLPERGVLWAKDQVVLDLGEDTNRHLETEIGYIIGKPITDIVPDVATLREHVEAVVAVIEAPGGAVEAVQPATATDLVAWNINAKDIIVGETRGPVDLPVDEIEVSLKHGGETVNTGHGGQAAGGQWATLLQSVNELVALGYPIMPGQIISNGALGKAVKAEPGAYVGEFGELGTIRFEVRAPNSTE
jgi:2-keto-4-pentenoate hydratase